ncbi:MAG: hypothetical protein H6Q88_2233, partial [Anaeromyxobacteraceae bacterium]|nr:hypothetical protein [Anaeromyxobacteraceae bacterium]
MEGPGGVLPPANRKEQNEMATGTVKWFN